MTKKQRKSPLTPAAGIRSPEVENPSRTKGQEQAIAALAVKSLRECPALLLEPFPGRALAIRAAKTDRDLARACVRYAAALMMLRTMRGQLPDLACEVVAAAVAQHVGRCEVRPKPSRRQIARAVEAAFAFVERAVGEAGV